MEKFIEKYKSYSSKVLQKLAKVKTGDELDAIESILASRGASQEHPAEEGAVYNATETEEYKAENGIKENDEVAEEKPKKARKAKTPKEPKEPRPLKKEVSAEEAQANLEKAKANIGRFCKFICTKTKEQTDGIIIGVRLDPRNNFIQYRIKTNDGHVWGKGIGSFCSASGAALSAFFRPRFGFSVSSGTGAISPSSRSFESMPLPQT